MINNIIDNIGLKDYIINKEFKDKLVVPIGIDINKEKYYMDFSNVSLLLIGGTTGTGKSNLIDNMIVSLLLKNSPEEVKFLLFDVKRVELFEYKNIPHLVKDCFNNVEDNFNYILKELEYRENLFVVAGTRDINGYNKQEVNNRIPHLFIVIDEFVEYNKLDEFKSILSDISISGRKLGVHLILATNGYFKDMFTKEEINLFNYIITFDLASNEQAKYLNIENGDLLKLNGEVLVKLKEKKILKLNVPYTSSDDINKIVDYVENGNYDN